jgi:hypothetical protein
MKQKSSALLCLHGDLSVHVERYQDLAYLLGVIQLHYHCCGYTSRPYAIDA